MADPESYLLHDGEIPVWFTYPKPYLRMLRQDLVNLRPWKILEKDAVQVRSSLLERLYPKRVLMPFAARQDNDDIACWFKEGGESVIVIHAFAVPGWEVVKEYPTTRDWFQDAVQETIWWE
jgi:hypothetical protein